MDAKIAAIFIVDGILNDLKDRYGLKQAFNDCDESIQSEIVESWVDIAESEIKQQIKKEST